MNQATPTTRRTLTKMAVVGVMLTVSGLSSSDGGLFDCFRHDYQPKNIFAWPQRLPLDLRRVALLPMVTTSDSGLAATGCEILSPVFQDELTKLKRFEVVTVDAKTLRDKTGRPGWAGAEALPPDFFSSLQKLYDCEAVMFCELTVFQAYPPLAVGWRLKLVDVRTKQVIWAADEVFDDGNPAVARGARRFAGNQTPDSDDWAIENSPRQFGHYAAATLLACLPEH